MDAVNLGLSALATISVLAVVPLVSLLQQRLIGRATTGLWPGMALAAGSGGIVSLVLWAVRITGIPVLFAAPITALGALFAVVATSPLRSRSLVVQALFSAIATALVFVPAAMAVFGSAFNSLFTSAGLIDLGASLPAFVAAGAAGLGVLVLERGAAREAAVGIRWWPVIWPLLLVWIAWIGWLVGIELAIDASTGVLFVNTILMPVAGAVGGVVVERIRHRSNTPRGLALGFLGGAIAATAACAFLEPALAVVTGLIAGALCSLPTSSGANAGSKSILVTAIVAGGTSLLLLGFFARNLAFIYTGQPELFFGQLAAVFGCAVYAFAVGTGLWWPLRRLDGYRRPLPRR
jgi:Amt family ammonium transporter